ncbi:MAG TPA: fructosamine kinase family protein [Cytophagaceae bacterium]|nr:fructosamine kinase family protein [Cytophagaceae bacterium]
MAAADLNFVQNILQAAFQKQITVSKLKRLPGGCINNAVQVESSSGVFFIKWNSPELLPMFETEAKGLEILAEAGAIRVPEVYAFGCNEECSYLILEFVEREAQRKNFWKNFGIALSVLHRQSKQKYGLGFNNYIGLLPQQNDYNDDWLSFFIHQRLGTQLRIGLDKGSIDESYLFDFDQLFKKIPDILLSEKPALVHGDLWSGNVIVAGQVCLIDPAVYYGNREAEIAFTKLFDGFDQDFYHAYQENFPMATGFEERAEIYNLYPLLVHVNLFGGSYLHQVKQTLKKFQ